MRLGRNTAGVLGTNVLNLLLSAGNSIFLTRLLGVVGKGEFAIFSASFGVLTLLLGMGLNESIRFFIAQGRVSRGRVLTSLSLFSAAAGLVAFLLVHINHQLFQNDVFLPGPKQNVPFELLLAGVVAVSLFYGTVSSVFAGHRSFKTLNSLTLGSAILSLVTYGGLLWLETAGPFHVTTGIVFVTYALLTLLTALAIGVMAYIQLGERFTAKLLEPALLRAMARYASVSYFATLAQFMNYRVDYWIVQHFCGAAPLGLYALAGNLAAMLWIVPRSVATVLGPAIAAQDTGATVQQAARIGRLVLVGSVALAVLPAPFAAGWIGGLYGAGFAASAVPFVILLVGCAPFTLCVVHASALAALNLPQANLKASCVGLVATVVLDLVLIPRFGILGAATASSLSYLVTSAVVLWTFARTGALSLSACLVPRRGDLRYVIDGFKNFLR